MSALLQLYAFIQAYPPSFREYGFPESPLIPQWFPEFWLRRDLSKMSDRAFRPNPPQSD